MYVRQPQKLEWLKKKLESNKNTPSLDLDEKRHILSKLNQATIFENFLHTKFVGQKRFSLEGLETLIPALDSVIQYGADLGVEEFMIGMAHRGRLNVLANILNKTYEEIFKEFEGKGAEDEGLFEGDVKYHLGFSGDKNRLGVKSKTSFLIACLIVILIAGLSNFGLLASTKHYLILLPVIASFLLSQKSTLKLFIILLIVYVVFAWAFINGWLEIKVDIYKYSTSYAAWLIDLFLISGAAWIILRIVNLYYTLLNEQYATISNINEVISDKEEIQRVLFESMNEAVLLLEGDKIINCNSEAKRIFGKNISNKETAKVQLLFPKIQHSIYLPLDQRKNTSS